MSLIQDNIKQIINNNPIKSVFLMVFLLNVILISGFLISEGVINKEIANVLFLVIYVYILFISGVFSRKFDSNKCYNVNKLVILIILLIAYEVYIFNFYASGKSRLDLGGVDILVNNSMTQILVFVCFVFISPFLEEIIFRAGYYKLVRAKHSVTFSVIFINILFGLGHGFSLRTIIAIVIPSIIWTLLYEHTNKITLPSIMHILHNMIYYILAVNGRQ